MQFTPRAATIAWNVYRLEHMLFQLPKDDAIRTKRNDTLLINTLGMAWRPWK